MADAAYLPDRAADYVIRAQRARAPDHKFCVAPGGSCLSGRTLECSEGKAGPKPGSRLRRVGGVPLAVPCPDACRPTDACLLGLRFVATIVRCIRWQAQRRQAGVADRLVSHLDH
jgi:hypothetical protein